MKSYYRPEHFPSEKFTKVKVNLPAESVSLLKEDAETHGITMTEALRRALGLQNFLAEEVSKGGKVLIERRNGRFRQITSL
jgi:hypothetical protein